MLTFFYFYITSLYNDPVSATRPCFAAFFQRFLFLIHTNTLTYIYLHHTGMVLYVYDDANKGSAAKDLFVVYGYPVTA